MQVAPRGGAPRQEEGVAAGGVVVERVVVKVAAGVEAAGVVVIP